MSKGSGASNKVRVKYEHSSFGKYGCLESVNQMLGPMLACSWWFAKYL